MTYEEFIISVLKFHRHRVITDAELQACAERWRKEAEEKQKPKGKRKSDRQIDMGRPATGA